MKRFTTLISLLFCCIISMAQTTAGWYKVFTGKIGEMDATLHLHVAADNVSGYLWFVKTPMPMQCYAAYNKAKDSLIINANANPISINLSGKISDSVFTGAATLEKENNAAKSSAFNLQLSTAASFTPLDYVYTKGKASMPTKMQNESTAEYFGATVWPKTLANKPLQTALKSVINKACNNKGAVKEPGVLLLSEKNKLIGGWKNDMAKMAPAEAKDMGLSLSVEEQNITTIMYEDERVITVSNFVYGYTGGAHGNHITTITNIDKGNGTVLKLQDVLTPEGIKLLPKLLEAVIRQQYDLDKTKSLEDNGLFVKTMAPSSNFYITNGNLGFYYAPYEVMAFSYGEPNLFIPSAAIAKYIQPAYKKL